MIVAPDKLEAFAADLLQAGGFTAEEARVTAKSLILSNLMGHDSHGIVRIRQYNEELKHGMMASGVDLAILSETENSLHADARLGLGQVQMPRLLERLFSKMEKAAIATGVVVNCGHVGRLGEWVEAAAEKGYIAFMAVNDNGTYQLVAPHGGIEPRTSTNPIAFACPLKEGDIFSLDLSTSATAMGKVRLAHLSGEKMPEGLLQDHAGNPTTDPAAVIDEPRGSILPFGGHKGFALSLMVDLLVSGLSGGYMPPAPKGAVTTNNIVIALWNPAFFAGAAHMQGEAEKYLAHIRSAKPKDAAHPVRIPGERAAATLKERRKNGVPIDDSFAEKLSRYAQALGVTSSPFPRR